MSLIIEKIEKEQMKKQVPNAQVGDTVIVAKYIIEGKKKRIQHYQGVVTRRRHALSRESITVRKVVDGVGVEKTFLLHSPTVAGIEILKKGKVRRAKLYYLRDRIGVKANRVKTKKSLK